MNNTITKHLGVTSLFICLFSSITYAQRFEKVIKGTVTTTENVPIPGASIKIEGSPYITFSDAEGRFNLVARYVATEFNLTIISIGYEPLTLLASNDTDNIKAVLIARTSIFDEIVVSASRQAEKIQESPAAISFIDAKKITMDNVGNPMLNLRNLNGVDVSQTGISGGQINLRGRGATFNTETFVIADYRNVLIPSLATISYDQVPVDAIDLDKIEVVKGPGGALYGPGVEAGIVHFISKSPFKQQGVTVSVGYGNQNQRQVAFRAASVVSNNKLGLKLTGFYRSATDFSVGNEAFQKRIAAYPAALISSVSGEVMRDTNRLNFNTEAISLTGTAEYKFNQTASLIGVAGISKGAGLFKIGEGDGYQNINRPFAQVRFQNKGFFTQVFWSQQMGNDGTAYLYNSGLTNITIIDQLEGQVQYSYNAFKDKLNLIVGADYRNNSIDTRRSINGRFEDSDKYLIFGSYAQAKLAVGNKIDLVAAGRIDRFTALAATAQSPRVGIVYKAKPKHTFRFTWNKAVGAPSALQLYNDFLANVTPAFNVWLNAGTQPLTFNDNNFYNFITKTNQKTSDIPLQQAYAAATQGLAASGALPSALIAALNNFTPLISGNTAATYINTVGLPTDLNARQVLGLSVTNALEAGYQGKFGEKISVSLDVYYNRRDNNLTPAVLAGALLGYPTIGDDLAAAVKKSLPASVGSLTSDQIAAIYKTAIERSSVNAATNRLSPLGLISADQSPTGKTLDLTYFNIDEIRYWGSDLSVTYAASPKLGFYTNYSWLSQTYWDRVGVKNSSSAVPFSLNQPGNRFRVGADYVQEKGLLWNVAFRYNSPWTSVNGSAFSGEVPSNNVVDAGVGYAFSKKLLANVSATNLFDKDIIMLPNSPYLKRIILGKITYNF